MDYGSIYTDSEMEEEVYVHGERATVDYSYLDF